MDLKRLLFEKKIKQIELAKMVGANYAMVCMQVNKHQLLPEKYRPRFCEILGITEEQLLASMNEGVSNE